MAILGIKNSFKSSSVYKSVQKYANKAEPKVLNRITGIVLALIGSIILLVNVIG